MTTITRVPGQTRAIPGTNTVNISHLSDKRIEKLFVNFKQKNLLSEDRACLAFYKMTGVLVSRKEVKLSPFEMDVAELVELARNAKRDQGPSLGERMKNAFFGGLNGLRGFSALLSAVANCRTIFGIRL